MKSLSLAKFLCVTFLLAGSVAFANEPTEGHPTEEITSSAEVKEDDKFIKAGDRQLSDKDLMEMQTQYNASIVFNAQAKPGDKAPAPQGSAEAVIAAMATANGYSAQPVRYSSASGLDLITTHNGAFYHPISFGLLGSTIKLCDESVWTIQPSYAYITNNWITSDEIVITPNYTIFSSYNYCLRNLNTNTMVKANLTLYVHPAYQTPANYQVIAYDDYNGTMVLSDGSEWRILTFDYSKRWDIYDTVIIGLNDGQFSKPGYGYGLNDALLDPYYSPNILINCNIQHYVRAVCYKR